MPKPSDEFIVLERCFVPEDTLVLRQGEPGNSAYIIQSGSVSVFTESKGGKRVELAKMETGHIFGEMALIFDGPRSASVKTLEDCNFIVINRDVFNKKLERTDPTIRAIVEMLTKRVVTANNAMIKDGKDIPDLINTTRIIYQNILSSLPSDQQSAFQDAALDKLDAFLDSVRSFQEEMR